MKTTIALLVALVFVLLLVPQAFAQGLAMYDKAIANKIAQGSSGNFKGTVVSCDPATNTCVFKGPKGNTATGNMTYAGYNGSFDAAKELQPGDKVTGQWKRVNGTYYATIVVKS